MITYADPLGNHRRLYLWLTVALLAAWCVTQALGSFVLPTNQAAQPLTSVDFGRLPLAFAPNAGQTDPAVLFTARAGGSAFYFTRSAVVVSLTPPRPATLPRSGDSSQQQAVAGRTDPAHSVRLSFVGANPQPQVVPGSRLPGTVNYFLGNDPAQWQTNLPTYGGITYAGLYPGIDLQYAGNQETLKGTYTLAAGADPTRIRWRYAGAATISVDAQGNLQIAVPAPANGDGGSGEPTLLTEQAPVAWQEIAGRRSPVPVAYALAADQSVGFALGPYDPAHPLIIDPTLSYSTFLGGNSADYGYAIAVDSQGQVYVTGATGSTDFPVVNPIYPPSPNGDLFVTKINADATAILYSTLIGGNSSDVGFGIAVDGTGNAYVTGETWSTNFPVVNPFQAQNGGLQSDAILLKVNPSGTALIYSTYLGGGSADSARDVAVDQTGSAYITGYTLSWNFPLANPFQSTIHGIQDGFVTKFQPSGSALVFSTFLGGGSDIEYSNSVAVDAQGAVYVAGYTASTDFPLQNPIQATNHGFGDTFITKFNPSGTSLAYSTYLGGSDNDIQYSGLAVDPAGNAYVTGYTDSLDFPVVNAYQSRKNGFEDVFLTKINAAGTAWVYSTYLGGIFPDGEYHTQVVVDSAGQAYVAGDTRSSDFPLVNSFQTGPIDASYEDVFVTKFDPAGQELVYSTRLGGNNGGQFNNLDHLYGLALDAVGNVYLTGETNSPQYPTTSGVFQPTKAANYDTFIAKISAQGPNTPTPTVTGTPPTATPTPCNASANYTVTVQTGVSIIPGTQDIGNHCDGCVTRYELPFPMRLYDRTFTSALVGSHGTVGFIANQNFDTNQCLPASNPPMFNYAILPFWSGVRTDGYGITCPSGCGIFTTITGSAPNRTLHIEWRGSRFSNGNFGYVNFELRLFEGSPNFQVVYGPIFAGGANATIGAQKDLGSLYVQYACNTGSIPPGTALFFRLPDCGATATATPATSPTRTATSTPPPTQTPGGPTATAVPSRTPLPGASPTATVCPIQFSDVPPTNPFYPFIRCLACRGIVSGYSDGTFGWPNPVTRGQLAKILANAGGLTNVITSTQQTFSDVVITNAFWVFIERLAGAGAISGYTCGGPGEPCDPLGRPYFRWTANATRGQISKITAVTAGWNGPIPTTQQTFTDVPPANAFWRWIEELASRGIIGGYACGGPGEPCDPQSRPYFRGGATATRGQMAKIAAETFFPNCATPQRR